MLDYIINATLNQTMTKTYRYGLECENVGAGWDKFLGSMFIIASYPGIYPYAPQTVRSIHALTWSPE